MQPSKDRRVTVHDDGANPATVLESGAGEPRLSKATEAAVAAGRTLTLEEYLAQEGRSSTDYGATGFALRYARGGEALRRQAEEAGK